MRAPHPLLAASFALAAACTGRIGGDEPGAGPPVAEDGTRADGVCAGVAAPKTRVVRLTHRQYDNAVRALLGVSETPASTFAADSSFEGFDNNADALQVGDRLSRDYARAAATLADTADVKKLMTCAPSDACTRSSIAAFLRRAFRRPASEEELAAYVALFAKGGEAIASGDDASDGMRLVVEAVLQTPSFLYRPELSRAATAESVIPLSSFEIASRLSFTLWNDTPDDALLDAAERGELATPEGVAEHAQRLLADPRALATVAEFHRQWLHLDTVSEDKLRRDPVMYSGFSPTIAPTLRAETDLFVREVFEKGGGLSALFGASFTYVNAQTAPLYGLTGAFGEGLVRVELDPSQRAGLFTQIGFLASHAYYDASSPIHRGVFIQRSVLCTELPDPPGDVDLKLPPLEGDLKTTRDRVTRHTAPSNCQSCHGIINPTGFAFENFDAVGKWRDTENGVSIDATGSALIGDQKVAFNGPMDFVKKMSSNPAAGSCYAKQWARYAYGRKEQAADGCSVRTMGQKLLAGASMRSLLLELVTSPSFRHRPMGDS